MNYAVINTVTNEWLFEGNQSEARAFYKKAADEGQTVALVLVIKTNDQ